MSAMSEGELVALYLAERLIQQLRGTPFEADLRRAIAKLGTMLPDGVSVRLDAMADMLSILPAAHSYYDPACLCTLTSAVVCRRRLDMVYWTASRNETTRRDFDPYDLALIDDLRPPSSGGGNAVARSDTTISTASPTRMSP